MDIDIDNDYYISDVYGDLYESSIQVATVLVVPDRDIEICDYPIDDVCYDDGAIDAALNTKNMR